MSTRPEAQRRTENMHEALSWKTIGENGWRKRGRARGRARECTRQIVCLEFINFYFINNVHARFGHSLSTHWGGRRIVVRVSVQFVVLITFCSTFENKFQLINHWRVGKHSIELNVSLVAVRTPNANHQWECVCTTAVLNANIWWRTIACAGAVSFILLQHRTHYHRRNGCLDRVRRPSAA